MGMKNCVTCKHSDIYEYKEPCASCENYQKWESLAPQWISVEDRLPSERVSVAVYINEGNGAYWIQTSYLNGGKWRIPGEYVVDRNITHWMTLPEPPKED